MVTLGELAMAAPTPEVQLALAVMQACFWFWFIPHCGLKVIKPMIDPKPWRDQFAKLSQKTFKNSFFVDFEDHMAYEFACIFLAIMVQHGVGGILCLPALIPSLGVPKHIAIALACHGALCEVGWELQDLLNRIYEVTCTPDGLKKNPKALLVIIGIHHTMGMSLVIPMNLKYPTLFWYHEGVFLLQCAAFAAMMAQNYGYTLDISSKAGLLQMKATVTFVMGTMLWSRGFRYAYVAYQILAHFRAQGDSLFLAIGGVAIGMMSLMNVLFILDCTTKFAKFIRMVPKTPQQLKMVRGMSEEILAGLQPMRPPVILTGGKRAWARLRGAHRMGALSSRRPSEEPSAATSKKAD